MERQQKRHNENRSTAQNEETLEVKALRDEISKYETKLADLHKTSSNLWHLVEHYSETGYLNKCAEIDNIQHPSNTNQETLQAIQQFIPSIQTLRNLQSKYRRNKFAQQYSAISFQSFFQQLNVMEYDAQPGELFDSRRMRVVAREHSFAFRENEVIRTEKCGLEYQGHILDLVECVVSLGPDESQRVRNAFGRRFDA